MRLTGRHTVDMDFENLTYSVSDRKQGRRNILKGVSGSFRAGEVTAVLGPSGAGKTTLVNILSGLITSGSTGCIRTNGVAREMKRFRKMSSYIMQDDLLQPRLTVRESMEIAVELKLGHSVDEKDKAAVVHEVTSSLGLKSCMNTRSENLSGGQRKRLSVALELVSNPPVIFLDEPTTGLDIVAIKNMVNLLRMLAGQGRTIICTIHQPTASLLSFFNRLYVVADGYCVYQGSPSRLVPFMSNVNLQCPITHNPADFVIEVLHLDKENIKTMSRAIANGKQSEIEHNDNSIEVSDMISRSNKTENFEIDFYSTFNTQFRVLLKRRLIQISRNTTSLWIQLIHHIISAVLIGGIFFDIGQDANMIFVNFKFYICVMVFYLYTYIMVPVLLFPMEIKLLKREYFNRWYGLKSFYASLSVATLPTLIPMTALFAAITYFMTNQPIEVSRFGWFFAFCLLISICSESIGLTVGSIFKITNGSIVAPSTVAPLLALCVYGMGYGQAVGPLMTTIMNMSFLRFAIVGLTTNVYNDRPILSCSNNADYCHYRNPKLFLRDLGMEQSVFYVQVIGLASFAVFFKIIAFSALRFRLTTEFSNKILNYIAKVLRRK
ncbi:ATP-binding cassette sub-family G member 1-like [Ctenocephalides felis]|uniref:ATP-binding cassette sub-family G member 1-like n=1 Tax=Ctenocephalides felis TaxID=7515 RepID=UPI000E6E2082|nr:ATP-binding cassette sub-family G member 1-like [Ctenocephalides felis]